MPATSHDATAEALSRYREALTGGAADTELAELARDVDPELIAAVRWTMLGARPERPQPDDEFVRQLRQTLLHADRVETVATATPLAARMADASTVNEAAAGVMTWRQRRWQWVALAATVLVLVITAVALRFVPLERPVPETNLAATGAPTTQTLFDGEVSGDAEAWLPLSIESWQMPPGSRLTLPRLEGPQWIVADTGAVQATIDGTSRAVLAGGSAIVPAGSVADIRNEGLSTVSLLRGMAATGFSLPTSDGAVSREVAFETGAHESLPPGESHVILERLTIPPGTTLKLDSATGQNWFDVVSGELGLTLIGDDPPLGWTSEQERQMAPNEPVPVLVPGTRIWLHNLGDSDLILYALRVEAGDE